MKKVNPYDTLSRGGQLEAFYVDLNLGGASRIIPRIPSQRQLAEVRAATVDETPLADQVELYAQVIDEQCTPYLHTEAGRLLGFAAVEGLPN